MEHIETTITSLPQTMQQLLELQSLQLCDEPPSSKRQARIADLSAQVPKPVLDHFNRLIRQGKNGVALAQYGTCVACHIKVSSGTFAALVHGTNIQICGNCGRYLYLALGEASSEPLESKRPAAPAPKKRTRKTRALTPA